ncbi:hypothetical protein GCM10023166_35940 [Paeniglutamicibacter cryotolerans]
MDVLVPHGRHEDHQGAEDNNALGRVTGRDDLVNRLSSQHGTGCGEAQKHLDRHDQEQRGAVYADLSAAGDHLRKAPIGDPERCVMP